MRHEIKVHLILLRVIEKKKKKKKKIINELNVRLRACVPSLFIRSKCICGESKLRACRRRRPVNVYVFINFSPRGGGNDLKKKKKGTEK